MTQQKDETVPPPAGPHAVAAGGEDIPDFAAMVELICHSLNLPEADVAHRLFQEAIQTGWNVTRDAEAFGLTPHVWSDRMAAFYRSTDAFAFELLVTHQRPECRRIDRWISDAIDNHDAGRRDLDLLVLGDGVGSDSLRFAQAGYRVTYFEFDGPSACIARERFRRAGLLGRIVCVHELEQIPRGAFDVVINREVLEHVPDPLGVIGDIRGYLREQGVAVITESFHRVEPAFPTHLASNAEYAGRTADLFVERGFRLLDYGPGGQPKLLQHADLRDASRWESLPWGRPRPWRQRLKTLVGRVSGQTVTERAA